MGKRLILYGLGGKFCFLLVLASMVLSFGLDEESISKENDLEIERKLEMLNKPAVKSIQSEDGDVIDCVDIYKQPSLDHPALKNHKIQMKPTITYPKTESTDTRNKESRPASQVWQKSETGSLDRYGMKSPYVFTNPNNTVYDITPNKTQNFNYLNQSGVSDALYSPYTNRSLAVLLTLGYNYTGARGEINVWNPQVEIRDGPKHEYSAAQMWVANGNYLDESAEAGWIVNPNRYGDNATRFFIYWTADNSDTTGCFDLFCPGFVQTNNEIVLGGKLDVSSFDGQQYHISLFMYWDNNTQNWWLEYDGKQVGYWPSELFGALKQSAVTVQWGGEVNSKFLSQGERRNDTHTSTAMGNGIEALHHYSAWIKNAKIIDNSSTVEKYPAWVHEYMDEPDCYSAYNEVEHVEEPVLYFGGQGRSPKCP
ncbi:hypothetical protein MKW92_036869 [Papaver armeniacum]|nr:hypothetical protein MKW92_036869 [Papaver armeniacum]